jgi:hypothetical protein
MIDEATLAQINGQYAMPPDAGPAWREACEYGFDMSLVEAALRMTPEERLEAHQHALNMILQLKESSESSHAPG